MKTDKTNGMSDNELVEKVHKSIIDEYGMAGYIRYIRLLHSNNDGQDYLKVREELNKTVTLDRVCEQSAQYNKDNK